MKMNKPDIQKLMKQLEGITTDKKKIIAVSLVMAALLYADCGYGLRLQFNAVGELNKKVSELSKNLTAFKKNYANIATYKDTRIQLTGKRLVSQDQRQAFIEYLYDLANKSHIRILQWKPDDKSKVKEETVDRVKVMPYIMSMDLLCGYHELGAFLNALEKGIFFVAVTDIKINPGTLDAFQQNAVLTIKIYEKNAK
jgi:hypothetical protein